MTQTRMHDDEIEITPLLVKKLVRNQFPQWSHLSIDRVKSAGTDNAMFRFGDEMVIRLPRIKSASVHVHKEQQFLPYLAEQLPLTIPNPIAKGKPTREYPFAWSIYSWLDGKTVEIENLENPYDFTLKLAEFIQTLHGIKAIDVPIPAHWENLRGVPLEMRDKQTRKALASLDGMIDCDAAIGAWEKALEAPQWDNDYVWIHADLQKGNLLESNGRLSAVIDFGLLDIGDPACDLQIAWNFLPRDLRDIFRNAFDYDDATWERGKGWALSVGVIALPYYYKTNSVLAGIARHAIEAVLADYQC